MNKSEIKKAIQDQDDVWALDVIDDTINERELSFIERTLSEFFELGVLYPEDFENVNENELVTLFSDGSVDDSKGHQLLERLPDNEIVRFIKENYDLFE